MLNQVIKFFIDNKLVAWIILLLFVGWGITTAPFDLGIDWLPRDPVSVDAIPDIGENQQIVYTKWMGRSPQDVEDQITYPLTTSLLGIPGVKSIRSNSMFGFSSIYVIFDEKVEFYWSRSRILEKLNSLPANLLPEDAQPTLGPDATALGQIYWYTLEGKDEDGNPTGGWDLHELRSIQDFYVRFGLSSAAGVSEVASIGGFIQEYQVDVDPDKMRIYGITLDQVMKAIKGSNLDIGAQTIEINLAEYFVRGLGYVKSIEDIEKAVVKVSKNVPIHIRDIARVNIGPATRRGILDKSGAEAVGGVVVARYGANPLEVINNVKEKIAEIAPGLPTKTLNDGTVSQVSIVPFYDRTELINETIGTLEEALSLEILITIIVVILMLLNLSSSLLVAGSLPVAVLMCFIAMRYFGVDANIVALSGIAIAVGTMVDMGIVLTESMVTHMKNAPPGQAISITIYNATTEVASAVITAVTTTVISFLPVFTMVAAEGKLFRPLAFTKTFALISSIIVAITIVPPLATQLFGVKSKSKWLSTGSNVLLIIASCILLFTNYYFIGIFGLLIGITSLINFFLKEYGKVRLLSYFEKFRNIAYAIVIIWVLAKIWMPLGVTKSILINFLFIGLIIGVLIGFFYVVIHFYENILRFLLKIKIIFLLFVSTLIFFGIQIAKNTGQEFMPALDEGSFLLMPTSMPHSGMEINVANLRALDMAVTAIPEVETVVGKAGRVESALDPAPMSMYENVILYKSEYMTDMDGHRLRFKMEKGDKYLLAEGGSIAHQDALIQGIKNEDLVSDKKGTYFRQWRDHIHSPDDIWNEIIKVTKIPGVTSAPKLQPIETRLVMLQTGMRAPMGIKVKGSDLKEIEAFGLELEKHLKNIEGVKAPAVFAERIVGKPYMLFDIDRDKISRYGLSVVDVQKQIQATVGGMVMTSTVEGRERYGIRIRYPRELRDDPEKLNNILVATPTGNQIPLADLVEIKYEQGPQAIKSEDGFLVGYVLFDRETDFSEVEVVNMAQNYLQTKIDDGELILPAGINYKFAGNYEQQVRASKRLAIVIPIALALIFLILYFQFSSVATSLMVFSGVFVAFSGGFIMIWLYGQPWFMDFDLFGSNMRDLFQMKSINLSVAVWVGFLALFGIATDDGVLVGTFLKDSFKRNSPVTISQIRDAVVEGGLRRVKPAMMTTATTILALLPILTSTGRGSDIMLPMAIPSFGGMTLQIITMFTVPVLYALWKEWGLKLNQRLAINKNIMKSLILGLLISGLTINSTEAQSINNLLKQAFENNPELRVVQLEYEAALQKGPQVSQLPDPAVGVGVPFLRPETRLGGQVMMVSASQMFPWFGTLKAKEDIAITMAKTKYEKLAAIRLDLVFQIKNAYYNLYLIEEKQSILKKHIRIFETLEKVSLAKVESGNSIASDVLAVRIKLEELQNQIKVLELKKQTFNAQINEATNGSINDTIQLIDRLSGISADLFNLEAYQLKIHSFHPMMKQLDWKIETSKKEVQLNALLGKPDFGVGLDYSFVNKRTDALPLHNGRDIIIPKVMISIPINRQKYSAKDEEERLNQESIELQKDQITNKMISMLQAYQTERESAVLMKELAEKQTEISYSAYDILLEEYSGKGKRFDELMKLQNEMITYELEIIKSIVQTHFAQIKIDRLTDF